MGAYRRPFRSTMLRSPGGFGAGHGAAAGAGDLFASWVLIATAPQNRWSSLPMIQLRATEIVATTISSAPVSARSSCAPIDGPTQSVSRTI